jgi:putative ABC transport system permease protein
VFRNYISAALGNIGRNGLYAGITILGLAVSFTAAILIGLYVRDEFSFDRFVPGHERVFRLESDILLPGEKPLPVDVTPSTAAAYMKLDFPEVRDAARLAASQSTFKTGAEGTEEPTAWVDPDFFRILPLPVFAGDPNAAMAAPDGLVLTRRMARKYFGVDAPIGRTILVQSGLGGFGLPADEQRMLAAYHPMRVMAILADPPSSSHLTAGAYASARAPFSTIAFEDRRPTPYGADMLTYVKLAPGAAPERWTARLASFAQRRYAAPGGGPSIYRYWLAPLDSLHFTATGLGPTQLTRPAGDLRVDLAIAGVGALVVAIAAINFITLMTARAARRAVEVGVRKAAGARRRDLIVQFMGETLIYVAVAMLIAVVAAELVLPAVNAFLRRDLKFQYATDLAVAGALVAAALLTTALAGLYPALVLSAFRPASALKGASGQAPGSAGMRHGLVIVQFAILTGLVVMTATIYRQTRFLLNDALRVDTDQVVRMVGPCGSSFEREAGKVPGVLGVACASPVLLGLGSTSTTAVMPDRSTKAIYVAPMGAGFFELHGVRPVAGRLFARDRGEDMVLDRPNPSPERQPTVILNESGARFLGYSDPEAAVGKTLSWGRAIPASSGAAVPVNRPSRIVGVVPDFSFGSARSAVPPSLYYVDPSLSRLLTIKLDRARIPEALEGLRQTWRKTGHDRQANIIFESQQIQDLYQDVITQGLAIWVCSGLAILIACLGLFALAAFVTERRTKEIGVRKAMGASSGDVVRLLLWQFSQPVLWANLIAWPAAFFAMDWWLHGFAYRVGQPVWLFLAASIAAALIAWITVSFQSWIAARARPATALRYE